MPSSLDALMVEMDAILVDFVTPYPLYYYCIIIIIISNLESHLSVWSEPA